MRDRDPKHADRLLSNANLTVASFARSWINFVIGPREELIIAIDWTDLDADGHSTIAAYLMTNHGRATPLLWKTIDKSKLAGRKSL